MRVVAHYPPTIQKANLHMEDVTYQSAEALMPGFSTLELRCRLSGVQLMPNVVDTLLNHAPLIMASRASENACGP